MFKYITKQNIAIFYLFAMGTQMIYFEGYNISMFKVAIMAISPLVWILTSAKLTKATLYMAIYMLVTTFALHLQWADVRSSTLWYSLLFFAMFNTYYSLIYKEHVFTLEFFIKVIKAYIFAYAIFLVLQQIAHFVGLWYFPIINSMGGYAGRGFLAGNSLAIEPSHSARILTVAFYVYIKSVELMKGRAITIKELFSENRNVVLAFLYTMLTMGSGTAFVGLAINALIFLRREYIAIVVPLAFILYFSAEHINYEPLDRAITTFNTALEGDTEKMAQVDLSAASRVNIIINTIKYFDITDPQLWLGYGIDSYNVKIVSAIADYGLLSYIAKLTLFFGCCFSGFFSLPVLMFVVLFSFNIGNYAYGWTVLMMLSTLKYFKEQKKLK